MIAKLFGRLVVVAIAFILALLVSFFILAYLGGQLLTETLAQEYGDALPSEALDFIGFIGFLIELYPAITLLPAVLVVAVGEIGRIRSWMYYVLAGGAASLMVPLFYVVSFATERDMPSAAFLVIFATAGFGGGVLYWLLAGRKA